MGKHKFASGGRQPIMLAEVPTYFDVVQSRRVEQQK